MLEFIGDDNYHRVYHTYCVMTSAGMIEGFYLPVYHLLNQSVYRNIICDMTEGFIMPYFLYYYSYHMIFG